MRPQTGRLGQLLTAVVILCMTLWLATDASAQQATAKIVGTVTDPQGLVVTGAKVTVTNTATNVATEATSDKSGFYQVLNLPIGTYKIVARHEGFRQLEVLTAPLEINQSFRADLKLEVGTASERVLVEAQAAGVETVNPTIGQSVTSRPIVNMPLNGRNVLSLALLQPGVTEDNPDNGAGNGLGFSVGGGRSDSITYLLDGGLNNDLLNNAVVYNPNPDSVAEFRILTSDYTAEYGRNGAGVITVVTKSGTNDFHGSAFEFLRNTDFDANAYFNKDPLLNPVPLPRNNLKRNQFGATFGGPIIKSRLFFFVAYQGQRQIQTDVLPQQQTFTTAELGGDFSQAGPNGGPDPNVVAFLQANPYFSTPADAANGIIDKIDPAAQAYIKTGLIPSNAGGEIFPVGGSTNNPYELTAKIDFNISSKDKLTGTIGGNRNPLLQPFGLNNSETAPGLPSTTRVNTSYLNIAYTRTFSPTQLNEFRVTAQRRNILQDKPDTNVASLSNNNSGAATGFGILSDISNGPPQLYFNDSGLIVGQDPYGPTHLIGNTFGYADTFTWVRGRNTWKFGAGFSAYQQNTLYDYFSDSNFNYYGAGGVGTGNAFADFLVGAPNYLLEGANAANNIRSKSTYGFAQDEWRVRTNLTLTLGIRYEYSTPKTDTKGRSFSIVPGDQSVRFPNAPLGLVFPGDPGAPGGANFPDKTNFGPRIGFAWSPASGGGKTSLRGGFGIFYDVLKGEDNLQFNGAPPFYSEGGPSFPCFTNPATAANCASSGLPIEPAFTSSGSPIYSAPWANSATPSSNPFPSQPPNPATAFNPATGLFLPFGGYESSLYFVNPHLHTPYTYQYNLSLQHEVARNLMMEVNYVGSSSKGLTALKDINPFPLSGPFAGSGSNPARILNENPTIQNTFGSFCGTSPGSFSACPFGGAELEFNNASFAGFNSLEASLTKQNGANRILGNTYFTLAYTYGHSIDDASGFRNRDSQVPYYDPGVLRGSSDFDVTHRVTFSGGWDLPFDRAWASGPKRLVKGWSLYPILTWRTGFPLSINSQLSGASSSDPGPSGAGDGYLANAVFASGFNKITILNPKTNGGLYFNPAAFQAISDTPGSGYGLPRDFFRGPGRTNLDLALAKTTAITERVNVEFRVEAFNALNHTEFANPDTNIADANFGLISSTTLGAGTNALQTQRILQLGGRLTF
jgi:hypothetical protein